MMTTMKTPLEDISMKGAAMMPKDEGNRLTPIQKDIRDRNAGLPKHVRRSIDRYRTSLGMVPLWGSSVERQRRPA